MTVSRRLMALLGVDVHVGWTFIARLAAMVAGVVALLPITHFLSPEQQGYYYTFASIIAAQALFELGLTQILVQLTSHEFAFLPHGEPVSGARAVEADRKIAYFAAFASRWFLSVAIGFGLVVSTLGLYYFHSFGTLSPGQWAPPWLTMVAATCLNLYLSPRLSFVEGAGFPSRTATLRLAQTLIGTTLLIALLFLGFGLWAAVALPATQALSSIWWLSRGQAGADFFARKPATQPHEPEWRAEILGLQWRMALSSVGGYFAYLTFTPLLFAFQGPVAAGQWGLTYSLMSQLMALGVSWTTARNPRFGALVATGARPVLDAEFRRSTWMSVGFVALASVAAVGAVMLTRALGLSLATRIVGPFDMALIGVATIASAYIFCLSTYMRAHKEEPLAASSLVIGPATALGAYIGAQFGLTAVAIAYLAVTMLINLPWRWAIYLGYRRRDGSGASAAPSDSSA